MKGRANKSIFGIVTIFLLLCAFVAPATAVPPVFDLSDFDPAVYCVSPLTISTDDALAGVFANIDDYAVASDTFRVLCFDPRTPIDIDDAPLSIINNSPLPLIIHGLYVIDRLYANDYMIDIQGNNVILHDVHIAHKWNGMVFLGDKGVRFSGNNNMLLDSWVYGFTSSTTFEGESNTVDGGIYDNITMNGYGNKVQSSIVDGCASPGIITTLYFRRSCAAQYVNAGGIRMDCPSAGGNDQLPGPFCTIVGNEIVQTKKAITLTAGSNRVAISQNNIPTDLNEHRIYDEDYSWQYYVSNDRYAPVAWHQVGVTNPGTYREDGGFRILGSLAGVPGINYTTDHFELFRANGDDAGFVTTCAIKQNLRPDIALKDSDGDTKHTIPPGALYFDCGVIDIGPRDEFSLTYTDFLGSTSFYTIPATVELDWHYHCAGSIAQFDGDLNPQMLIPGIRAILQNASTYASDFPNKRVLCFPDEEYAILFTPSYGGAYVSNAGKKLILHNLNMRIAGNPNTPPDAGTALLNIAGENVRLIKGKFIKADEDLVDPVGVRAEGGWHEIAQTTFDADDVCIDLDGYGHVVDDNDISGCTIGVNADCAWPDPGAAVKPSCTIGPDNYFHDIYDSGEYCIFVPETAQNVMHTQNTLQFHPLSWSTSHMAHLEEGANDGILPIDAEQSGFHVTDTTCVYNNPDADCFIVGELNERYCEEDATVEAYTSAGLYEHLQPFATCEIFTLIEDTPLVRHYEDQDIVNVTLHAGDCAFRCSIDLYTTVTREGELNLAYTLTDEIGNTSAFTELIGYYNPFNGCCIFASAAQPQGAEEEFGEDDSAFVAPDDDAGDGEAGDAVVSDEPEGGDADTVATLAGSMAGRISCSLNPGERNELPIGSILAIMASVLIIIGQRRRWTRKIHIS